MSLQVRFALLSPGLPSSHGPLDARLWVVISTGVTLVLLELGLRRDASNFEDGQM